MFEWLFRLKYHVRVLHMVKVCGPHGIKALNNELSLQSHKPVTAKSCHKGASAFLQQSN